MSDRSSADGSELAPGPSSEVRGPRSSAGLWSAVVRRWAEVSCAVLLLIMAISQIAVISSKSITADEIVMIPAGYYHVIEGNPTLIFEHPPLAKILAGLTLPFFDLAETPS